MKKITTFFFLFSLCCGSIFAQLNMSLLSNVQYNQSINDIWGWADPVTGVEYALVGTQTGVSVVSLADPTNAVEVDFVSGPSSTWRDLKTWGNFAYVSNENTGGVNVIDLSFLPDSVSATRWEPTLEDAGGKLTSIHNLYVDEFGVMYIAGSSLNGGGLLFVDVATDPGNPIYLGKGASEYAHDAFARDNKLYSSEIYQGRMAIYDITDKNNAILLGTQNTPFNFTHNIWLNDASTVAFTTDERGDAPVAAYDITDFSNIQELDTYRPVGTVGRGVIPHNVHVWNDWLVISYYTDGGRIVDASRPDNLIEVGNFDTFLGSDGGFSGAWGLYPFLPSGNVLITDIGNGLYVCGADYVRAGFLEGRVTDASTGNFLSGVDVIISSEEPNLGKTNGRGDYKTGQATPGNFDVTYSKLGYVTQVVEVTLENGEVTIQDVQLEPEAMYALSGQVVDAETGEILPNAQLYISSDVAEYAAETDVAGNFTVTVLRGDYNIFAGVWGYLQGSITDKEVEEDASFVIELERGYQDDFAVDLGWTVTGTAGTGAWELGVPNGTTFNGLTSNPSQDIQDDLGNRAYVTGNAGGGAGDDDVDDGTTILTSPIMDLTDYTDPIFSYNLWFFNSGGSGSPNDQLQVVLSNGTDEIILETVTQSRGTWRPRSVFTLEDLLPLTDNMTIRFETGDQDPGHLVEAAVDKFLVADVTSSIETVEAELFKLTAAPNPFTEQVQLSFDLDEKAMLNVYNTVGQLVEQQALQAYQQQTFVGADLPAGLYFVELQTNDKATTALKILKK